MYQFSRCSLHCECQSYSLTHTFYAMIDKALNTSHRPNMLIAVVFDRFIIDSWQYFGHRLFHTNRFLYKHFHSLHHRLYVPYCFGGLYNHWVEAIVLDIAGAAIAHEISAMTVRQGMLLFTFATSVLHVYLRPI